MVKTVPEEYKKKYQVARHHAWAGSVLLAILLSIRILVEISDINIKNLDMVILILGIIIIFYTISALFLSYKYRSGVLSEQDTLQIISSADELEKQRLKIEKKKTKSDIKKAKKK